MPKSGNPGDISYHYPEEGNADELFRFMVERSDTGDYSVKLFHGEQLLRQSSLKLRRGEAMTVTAGFG